MKKIIFLKKNYIIIGLIVLLIVFAYLYINVFTYTNQETFNVTTFKRSYSILSEISEKDYIEIQLYITDKNVSLVDKNKINDCYLYDDNNQLKLELIDLISINNSQIVNKINDDLYYLYSYIFLIEYNVLTETDIYLDNAKLKINILDNEYEITIGSLSYTKINSFKTNNNIMINKIIPIINFIDKNDLLLGLDITLTNTSNNDILIDKIELLDKNIKIGTNEIIYLKEEYQSDTNINEIIGYSYNYKYEKIYDEELNLKINKNSTVHLLLPVKYLNEYKINSFGIEFDYIENNEEKIMYFDDYLFFKSSYVTYKKDNVIIQTYNIY